MTLLDPLLREKENVPSLVAIVTAIIPAPGLLVFVARPDLFNALDLVHLLILLAALGYAMLIVCTVTGDNIKQGQRIRAEQVLRRDGGLLVRSLAQSEYQWLYGAASAANIVFLLLAAWAYWHKLRLGATLVAVALVLTLGSFLIKLLMVFWPIDWTNPPGGGKDSGKGQAPQK